MKNLLLYIILFISASYSAQIDTVLVKVQKYTIDSKTLETDRNYWVSLPTNYDSTKMYPVIYVLDAEYRFSITNALEKELSTNDKIPAHIIVGITHSIRKLDMTFSTTKVMYDGKTKVDPSHFNAKYCGDGPKFLKFIEDELIVEVNERYSSSGFNILIGHSLGGYFCSYILPIQKSFGSLQIYDPSIWYSKGEAIEQIENNLSKNTDCVIFLSSSSNIERKYNYHHKQIRKLNRTLNRFPNISNEYKYYKHESHNSMYLHSFIEGMSILYDGYEKVVSSTKE